VTGGLVDAGIGESELVHNQPAAARICSGLASLLTLGSPT